MPRTFTPPVLLTGRPLPGRSGQVLQDNVSHFIFGENLRAKLPHTCTAYFAMGCFWGAEKLFWQTPGVRLTAVGYLGGLTLNPTYEEVCSGRTGHAETVKVLFDPTEVSFETLLAIFFENHDPTSGMRQGNDVGTQYRSLIGVTSPEQRAAAEAVRARFGDKLKAAGYPDVTTEIIDVDDTPTGTFYFAEAYHQQYGEKNDRMGRAWYCPVHATGVRCDATPPASSDAE